MVESHVLVLNASYEPLGIVSLQRAIKLVLLDKAEVVQRRNDYVRSRRTAVVRPLVIRLLRYVTVPHRNAPCTRHSILLRDNYSCQYCGVGLPARQLTLDHVVPRAQGGQTTWENVVAACRPCNHRKGNRTASEARMVLRATPRTPSWLGMLMRLLDRHPVWQDYVYV